MGFRPYNPGAGGGGSSRTPVLVSGSPFADFTALDTWSQTNTSELLNNSTQYATAQVGASPDFVLYEWVGADQVYSADGWSSTSSITPEDRSTLDSIQSLTDMALPRAESGNLVDSPMSEGADDSLQTDGTIQVGTNTLSLGNAHKLESAGDKPAFFNDVRDLYRQPVLQEYEVGREYITVQNRYFAVSIPIETVDDTALTNPSWTIVIPQVSTEDGQTAKSADVVFDATTVTTNVKLQTEIEGVPYTTIDVGTVTVGNYTFNWNPPVDFLPGQTVTFSLFSEDGDVVMRGNSGTNIPVVTVDVLLYNNEQLAFLSDVGGAVLMWGDGSVGNSTTTRYLTPGYDQGIAPTSIVSVSVPRGGTLRNMYIRHNDPSGNSNPITYTVLVNGLPTPITISLAANSTGGQDLANSFAVSEGDLIAIEASKLSSTNSPSDIVATMELY